MRIDPPRELASVIAEAEAEAKLLADAPTDPPLEPATDPPTPKLSEARSVCVLIGPEGGWTDAERASALEAGFTPWRFGPHVCRVEVAALAAAAILRAMKGPSHA